MLALSLLQLANGILVIIFLFLAFRLLESRWSYKISKPFAWDEAVNQGLISTKLKRKERSYRDKVRFYTFWLQIKRLNDETVKGAFAEIGVYKGEMAAIIHLMDQTRSLHLFDTFKGFDARDVGREKNPTETVDFTDTNIGAVLHFINGNENVHVHAGYFPDTTAELVEQTYALVSIDADLHGPTLAALQYFYPRMSPGGVIIVHDYNHNWDGARRAVDEFSFSIHEVPVPVADWQGSVVIIKNHNERTSL
jgi:O-methyltransferase